MDTIRELEYLKDLNKKHGRYLKQYFGFSLSDFSQAIGISRYQMSNIIAGRKKLGEEYRAKFLEAFRRFSVEEKSKDFKPSNLQLIQRKINQEIRLTKQGPMWHAWDCHD